MSNRQPAGQRSVESYVLASGFHGKGHVKDIAADAEAGRRGADGMLVI